MAILVYYKFFIYTFVMFQQLNILVYVKLKIL